MKGDNIFIDVTKDPHCEELCSKDSDLSLFNSKTKFKIKIGDFGESKSILSYNKESVLKGNTAFRAPEYKLKKENLEKADIWSFGTMMLYLLMPGKLSSKLANCFSKLEE